MSRAFRCRRVLQDASLFCPAEKKSQSETDRERKRECMTCSSFHGKCTGVLQVIELYSRARLIL